MISKQNYILGVLELWYIFENGKVYKELVSFIKSENFIGLNWQDIENFQPKSILKSEQFLLSSEFQIKEEPKEMQRKRRYKN